MALDGVGNYTPPVPEFPAVSGEYILASDFNAIIIDIAAAISQAIFRDGQAVPTANMPWGNFKITGLGAGANPGDAVNFLQAFTDPTFVATTVDGVQVTGTALTVSAALATLPANTTIGPVTAVELGYLTGLTSNAQAQLNSLGTLKAPLASPTFTGDPKAPTPAPGDNDTSLATTAFVQGELVAKAPLASPVFTGNPTAPTPAFGDNDTSVATTAFVRAEFAPLASPSLTGIPTAPTAPPGTGTLQIATTDFVNATALSAGPVNNTPLLAIGTI